MATQFKTGEMNELLKALEQARDEMVRRGITPGPEIYNAIDAALTNMATQFKIGDRVMLTEQVEHYPLGIWRVGETGTIANIIDNVNGETGFTFFIKMDKHFPVLNEWQNELQVDDYENEPTPLALVP